MVDLIDLAAFVGFSTKMPKADCPKQIAESRPA